MKSDADPYPDNDDAGDKNDDDDDQMMCCDRDVSVIKGEEK